MIYEELKAAIQKDLIPLLPEQYNGYAIQYTKKPTKADVNDEYIDFVPISDQAKPLSMPVIYMSTVYEHYLMTAHNYATILDMLANTYTKYAQNQATSNFLQRVTSTDKTREEYLEDIALNLTMFVVPENKKDTFLNQLEHKELDFKRDDFATYKLTPDLNVYFFLIDDNVKTTHFIAPILQGVLDKIQVSIEDIYAMAQLSTLDRETPEMIDIYDLFKSSEEFIDMLGDKQNLVPPKTFYLITNHGKPFGTKFCACKDYIYKLMEFFHEEVVILPSPSEILIVAPFSSFTKDIPAIEERFKKCLSLMLGNEDPWIDQAYGCYLDKNEKVQIRKI